MDLSETMEDCIDYVQDSDHDELIRYDGGFWATEDADGKYKNVPHRQFVPQPHFGTRTIRALIRREIVTVLEKNRYGRATRVRLVNDPRS